MSDIRNRAVLIRLRIGTWAGYKTDKQVGREVSLMKKASLRDVGSYTKKLLGKEEAHELNSIKNKATSFYTSYSLPWEDTGYRILPTRSFMEYSERTRGFKADFLTAKENFITSFHKVKESGRRRLGDMYREEDYPTMEQLKEKIYFSTSITQLPGGTDFRLNLPDDQVKAIKTEAIETERKLAAGIIRECCKRMYGPLKIIVDKVNSWDNKWQENTLKSLGTIAQSIEKLNIVDDPVVTDIARKITEKIVSQNIYNIKNLPSTREGVLKTGKEILEVMEGII